MDHNVNPSAVRGSIGEPDGEEDAANEAATESGNETSPEGSEEEPSASADDVQ